ncbi:MAG: protein-L-isoaspartate O-methyltransferase [Elusimicrobia bacterium RIFCSPLOWO2_02_FULL_61_11]|nr:MAG: protein-L-isoaspartate O-methyltransferase [Elusimicrobia bacterium RIFCSPLOWO2_02_FULL_61_11]
MEILISALIAAGLLLILAMSLGPKFRDRAGGSMPGDAFQARREGMAAVQIESRGVRDPGVLKAMREVPRHEFVPEKYREDAYKDHPLPIGYGQTISQPYIVAYMSQALELKPGDKVLEIGTGSGYQAAVLALLAGEVFSVEIICDLERGARKTLDRLGYSSVHTRCADGYKGWPEEAPFDAIMVTAAPERVPQPLLDQLKPGGRLVMPVGSHFNQELILIRKTDKGLLKESLLSVIFVPMTGEALKNIK